MLRSFFVYFSRAPQPSMSAWQCRECHHELRFDATSYYCDLCLEAWTSTEVAANGAETSSSTEAAANQWRGNLFGEILDRRFILRNFILGEILDRSFILRNFILGDEQLERSFILKLTCLLQVR